MAKKAKKEEKKAITPKEAKEKPEKGGKKGKKDKKKKKGQEDEPDPDAAFEALLGLTDLDTEKEDVQFTDTSYTSASFESLPPAVEEPVHEEHKQKKKKKKKEVEEVISAPGSTEFVWSVDTPPLEEEKEEVVEIPPTTGGGAKKGGGKKGKKAKKGKKGQVEEEIPEFEKPKNWKKMNTKERTLWQEQRVAQWRDEQEQIRLDLVAGVKEKRKNEAAARAVQTQLENDEQEVRRDLLQKTCNLFQQFQQAKLENDLKKQMRAEWQQYLLCDGLPDTRVVTQMNTYIHCWRLKTYVDAEELQRRCVEVIPMLVMLEEICANAKMYSARQAENYQEVRTQLREGLNNAIQAASYFLLRDIERNLVFPSIKLATFEKEFQSLRLNIWCTVRMPQRKPKDPEPEPEPIELSFPAMKVSVTLPKTIDHSCICVRAARSMLDLISESTRTFKLQEEPVVDEDLFVFNVKELIEVTNMRKENEAKRKQFFKEIREKVKAIEAAIKTNPYINHKEEEVMIDNLTLMEPEGLPDPRDQLAEMAEKNYAKYLKRCNTRTRGGELHLRKYRICGGVLNLDLLTLPPQPKIMKGEVELTTLPLPKQLVPMAYQVQWRAPSPPPAGVTRTPEEIEAEMKKIEAQYEKLALVFIELPQDVMWLEPPVVVQWQENRKLWTTNYINDYKYNEDKLTLQFRTGVLWPIGLGTPKFSNMPYQGWDLRPDPGGKGVLVSVSGLCLTVCWLCLNGSVVLKSVTNATTRALHQHLGKKFTVKRMVQIMREAAVDFFPDFDSHNYIEGSAPKYWIIERHTYHAMAFLSRAYNFQWSRWNAKAGFQNIVMQFREAVDKKREGKLQLLRLSPFKTVILVCDETSNEYSPEPIEGIPFYPDLFTLNMSYGSVDARREAFCMKYKLVETVYDLLRELKICSFA